MASSAYAVSMRCRPVLHIEEPWLTLQMPGAPALWNAVVHM